jgi:hypothetical protein
LKKGKGVLALLSLLGLVITFCVMTGGQRLDVFLNDFMAAGNMETVVVDVGVVSSAGYIRTLEANQEEGSLYEPSIPPTGLTVLLGQKIFFLFILRVTVIRFISIEAGKKNGSWFCKKNNIGSWERAR